MPVTGTIFCLCVQRQSCPSCPCPHGPTAGVLEAPQWLDSVSIPSLLQHIFKVLALVPTHFQHAEGVMFGFSILIQYQSVFCRKWILKFSPELYGIPKAKPGSKTRRSLTTPKEVESLSTVLASYKLFFTIKFNRLLPFFSWFVCTVMCTQVQCPQRPEGGTESHRTGVTDGWDAMWVLGNITWSSSVDDALNHWAICLALVQWILKRNQLCI